MRLREKRTHFQRHSRAIKLQIVPTLTKLGKLRRAAAVLCQRKLLGYSERTNKLGHVGAIVPLLEGGCAIKQDTVETLSLVL
eukprot:6173322-Pleurochrysis_carterae.AAC.1